MEHSDGQLAMAHSDNMRLAHDSLDRGFLEEAPVGAGAEFLVEHTVGWM
jgi:hypothetical protein